MVVWGVGCVGSDDEVMGNGARVVDRIQGLECFETIARNLDFILDLMGEPLTLVKPGSDIFFLFKPVSD